MRAARALEAVSLVRLKRSQLYSEELGIEPIAETLGW